MRNGYAILETKAAAGGDDDLDEALETVAKTVEERTEKKLSKLIETTLKPFTESVTNIEKKMNRPSGASWTLPGGTSQEQQNPEVAALESKAVHNFLKSPAKAFDVNAHLTADEVKTMTVGSDPDGGYTVFPVLSQRVNKRVFDQSAMRRVADVQTLTSGDAWEEPIDFDDLGAAWVSETESRPETSTPQVGVLRIELHEIYAMPKVSQKMIDTSSWNIGDWLEGKLGDRFGRTEGLAFISGDGIKKPKGMLTYPRAATKDSARPFGTIQTVPTGNATQLTSDGIIALAYSLRAPYRPGARWMMSTATAGAEQLLKDADGRYMWNEGKAALPTLLGFPVELDENMPDVGAGSVPIAFGNFQQAYTIIDRPGFKVLQDPYTAKPYVLFYTYKRVGGGLRNSEAVKLQLVSI